MTYEFPHSLVNQRKGKRKKKRKIRNKRWSGGYVGCKSMQVITIQAWRKWLFPCKWAKFPSSRADFHPVWDGFPYVFLYFLPPNHKISWQGASCFACFFQALLSMEGHIITIDIGVMCLSCDVSHVIFWTQDFLGPICDPTPANEALCSKIIFELWAKTLSKVKISLKLKYA